MNKFTFSLFLVILITKFQYSNAQCLPNDTIANQNTSGVGPASICGVVPCENLNFLDGDLDTFYTTINCRKIIMLKDSIDGINLGNVTVCENINCSTTFFSGQPVLNRSFKITPTNNGKAYVSLFILQGDIDEYNAAAFPTWPALDPSTNLSILQFDTTIILGTPYSSMTYIPNSSVNTSYDTLNSVWTISFPVDSFSNFIITTPVTLDPTISSNINSIESLSILPNPVQNNLHLELNSTEYNTATVQILDLAAREIKNTKFTIKKGLNQQNIDLSNFKSGAYIIRVSNKNGLNISEVIIKE